MKFGGVGKNVWDFYVFFKGLERRKQKTAPVYPVNFTTSSRRQYYNAAPILRQISEEF